MDWTNFQDLIKELYSRFSELNFEFESEQIKFEVNGKTFSYTEQDYNIITSNLSGYKNKDTYIYTKDKFEILVDPVIQNFGFRNKENVIAIADETLSYEFSLPSDDMVLAFLSAIFKGGVSNFRRPSFRLYLYDNVDENVEINLFYLISNSMRIVVL